MNRWEDALFMQTEHMRFLESPGGLRYYDAFDRSMRAKEYEGDNYGELPENWTWQVVRKTLQEADPVYIAPNVCDMIEYARESFQPEPVLATDLFCAQGFAYMHRPQWIIDKHGKPMPLRAFAWMPIRVSEESGMESGGVWVTFYCHRDDDQEAVERGGYDLTTSAFHGVPHATLTVAHSFFLPYGVAAWEGVPEGPHRDAMLEQWTMIQVLWRLGSQVVRSVRVAPRHARKDARRHGNDNEAVTVITLRKVDAVVGDPSFNDSEGEGGHLSCQFVVRGHWRNQWYSSLQAHRQIWIAPFIKGPEGAPLRKTQRVFELVR
jgi:hypothetical protein